MTLDQAPEDLHEKKSELEYFVSELGSTLNSYVKDQAEASEVETLSEKTAEVYEELESLHDEYQEKLGEEIEESSSQQQLERAAEEAGYDSPGDVLRGDSPVTVDSNPVQEFREALAGEEYEELTQAMDNAREILLDYTDMKSDSKTHYGLEMATPGPTEMDEEITELVEEMEHLREDGLTGEEAFEEIRDIDDEL